MKPVILIDHPTLSHNIGAVARAMLNFDLTELRIIAPREGWLNADAVALAAGADSVLNQAQVYDNFHQATQDLDWIYATTARPRGMNKAVFSVKESLVNYTELQQDKRKVGFLFGSEKSGLPNEIITLCNAIISIPLNPDFSSINLAQSVIIVAYELYQHQLSKPIKSVNPDRQDVAPKQELHDFLGHLEVELEMSGYWRVDHKKTLMMQTLRNIYSRILLTSQEVRTLRGVISSLVNPQGIYSRRPKRQKPHNTED